MGTTCDCKEIKNPANGGNKKVCRRCGSEPYVLLDQVHLECRSCFLEYCIKKMRSTIGKTQLLKNNDSIVVAYSGGPSSRALLELLKDSIEKNTSRREQKLKPIILHIDVRDDISDELRASKLHSLLSELATLCPVWPLYWTTIESVMISDQYLDSMINFIYKFSSGQELYTIQRRLSDKSVFQVGDLADSLQKQCNIDHEKDLFDRFINLNTRFIQIASMLKGSLSDEPKFVFTAENATSISNNVMKSVIFGRGDKMNTLAGVTHQYTDSPVIHMRPLRDFSSREIAFFLRLKGISQPIQYEDSLPYSRISDRTESYLASLDVLHSSTYTTLIGVASRMRPKQADDLEPNKSV